MLHFLGMLFQPHWCMIREFGHKYEPFGVRILHLKFSTPCM